MTTVDWKRVRSIFEEAVQLTGDARDALVSRRCGEDEVLRAGVEELLAADSRAEGVLESPGLPSDPRLFGEVVSGLTCGHRIGSYTIQRTIAVGGMGTVFEAEQESPRRTVALKVIRFGLATPDALRRARYEAEVLARLQHPGIAQVFEAGTYRENGGDPLPFFAMEYVEGARSLIEYADETRLDRGARLDLFARVCAAVQHGHEKGVIHRDLKPGNILVDASGDPKVIDFGLARAADPQLVTDSLRTEAGHIAGTLQYMAPEQLEADPSLVDTRADLYALGVVLYELLCGCLPIDVRDAPLFEAARRLTEDEPARPSSIREELPQELDWILGKTLEKDPARRYASVSELVEDLRRFRVNQPVLAGPPSQVYRLSLFVRRHRLAVGAGTIVVLALILGVIGTGTGWARAKEAQKLAEGETIRARKAEEDALAAQAEAQDEADKYEQVADFTRGIFDLATPFHSGGEELTARELLDRGAEQIELELRDRPVLRGAMLWTLGEAYRGLGSHDRAIAFLEESLEVRLEAHGDRHLDVARSLTSLGIIYRQLNRFEDAERCHRKALEIRRELLGEQGLEFAYSLNSVAQTLKHTGDLEQAEGLARRALGIQEAVLGKRNRRLTTTLNNLAVILQDRGDYQAATEFLDRAVEICDEVYDRPHPHHAFTLRNRGVLASRVEDLETSRRCQLRALEIARDLYPGDYHLKASILSDLAQTTREQGEYREAIPMMTEALEMRRRIFGDVHSDVAMSLHNLASVWKMLRELDKAEAAHRESLSIRRQIAGDESGSVAMALSSLASVLRMKGNLDEAAELYDQALQINLRLYGERHRYTVSTRLNLGRQLRSQGRYGEAEEQLEIALWTASELAGPESWMAGTILDELGTVLRMKGEYDLAEEAYRESLEIHRTAVGQAHPQTIKVVMNLTRLLRGRARADEAEALLVEGLSALEENGAGDDNDDVQLILGDLTKLLESAGQAEKAARYRERLSDY